MTKHIGFEAGFHYHSTQPTTANSTSAFYQFVDISKTGAIVVLGRLRAKLTHMKAASIAPATIPTSNLISHANLF